jgi:hypothetical protein
VLDEQELGATDGDFALRVVESYPGGVGYVERLDPLLAVEWLRLTRLLVERVGGKDPQLLLHAPRAWWTDAAAAPSALAAAKFFRGDDVVREPRAEGDLFGMSADEGVPSPGRGSPKGVTSTAVVEEIAQFLKGVVPLSSDGFAVEAGVRAEDLPAEVGDDADAAFAKVVAQAWAQGDKRIRFDGEGVT